MWPTFIVVGRMPFIYDPLSDDEYQVRLLLRQNFSIFFLNNKKKFYLKQSWSYQEDQNNFCSVNPSLIFNSTM